MQILISVYLAEALSMEKVVFCHNLSFLLNDQFDTRHPNLSAHPE